MLCQGGLNFSCGKPWRNRTILGILGRILLCLHYVAEPKLNRVCPARYERLPAGLLPHLFDLRVATDGDVAPIAMHALYAPLAKPSKRLNLTWGVDKG